MAASWTAYLVGPFYTLLPKRWRRAAQHGSDKYHARAALISGVGEALVTLFVLAAWYMRFFGVLREKYAATVDTSPQGSIVAPEVTGGAGLLIFAMHPLTWLILYFGIEGI